MKTYEYDIVQALGETIMEKYEALYVLLAGHNKEAPIRFVIGPPDIISMFEVATAGFEPSPIVNTMGELTFVGKVIGNVPESMRFQVFKSERAAKDELLLFSEEENAVVKFVDWFYERRNMG